MPGAMLKWLVLPTDWIKSNMCWLTAILAVATATKHYHPVDWTAIAAVAALLSSFAAILVAVFNPWIGYTKARLDPLTEKLEKLYRLVKEQRKEASEMMFHYVSNVPTKTDERGNSKSQQRIFEKFN